MQGQMRIFVVIELSKNEESLQFFRTHYQIMLNSLKERIIAAPVAHWKSAENNEILNSFL